MKENNSTEAFTEMSLSPQILKAIKDIGYIKPTSIQTKAIPPLLEGCDFIGRSSTGSGKTAAFSIPAIEATDPLLRQTQVLVLSPTRELAIQIYNEMKKFSKYKRELSLAAVYGGASMGEQIRQLRNAHIVIGTPGRLLDHIRRKTLRLDHIQTVILDEADEMLNMGFIDDIETILTQAPADRQTVLFSATMSAPLLKISNTFLTNPQTVDVLAEKESQANIEQTYYQTSQKTKKDTLTLLMHTNDQRVIVFSNTKSMADELAEMLSTQGFKAAALHGDMTQPARNQVMQDFRKGNVHILVATDVAARGIDVDDVDVVINYDLPQSFEYYIHRIGRTGRAGKQGLSQTLICSGKQYATLRSLMSYTGSKIHERQLPTSSEAMNRTVMKTADKIQAHSKRQSGEAAQKLVESLLANADFDGSLEQVAIALAKFVIGDDVQFDRLKNVEGFTHQSTKKKPFQNASEKNRNRRKSNSKKAEGAGEQKVQRRSSRQESQSTKQKSGKLKKKQRSRVNA